MSLCNPTVSMNVFNWTDQLKALVTFKSDLLWLTAAKTAKNHSRCCLPLTWRRRVQNRCRKLSTRHHPPQTAHTNNPGGWGGARRYTVSSGGRPLRCRRHAWCAVHWKTYSSMSLSQQRAHRPACQKLLFQHTSIHWVVSLPPLWIQPVSLVFNYLSQYECIELQHESNHKVYIQDQGRYDHLRGAVKITLVICRPGSKQSSNIWG